jgi:membrane-associated phospholipid phosphatase
MRVELPRRALQRIESADGRLVRGAEACRCRALDGVFLPLSLAGAFGVPWIALEVTLRYRRRGGDRLPLARTAATTVAGWAAGKGAKKLAFRERPCHDDDPSAVTRCPDSSSFPSDQASAAFAAAAAIAAALPELAVPVYAGAAATALARVYVRVHFPSDVAAGALLGLAVAALARRIAA